VRQVAFQHGKKCLISWRFTPLDVENEKYPERPQETESQMAQVAGMSAALLLILVILFAGIIFLLPISPRTSVTFVIQSSTVNYQAQAHLTATYVNYVKIPLGTALASVRDTLILNAIMESNVTPPFGSFVVAVIVSYDGQTIATASFQNLNDGTFQTTLTLLPRQETSTTPYVFVLTLLQANGNLLDRQTANVYPS
jgi:hypothetical protein